MKNVKFKSSGKWAEVNPASPQFAVEAGQIVSVSDELADIVVEAKKGTIVKTNPAETDKGADDKAAAEDDKAAADKAAAEKKGK